MFRVIVVDDEIAALKRFHRVASNSPMISIEGEFLYAEDAMAFVREHTVDVAFLDIEMPEMGGLELAERLMEINPYMKVIFITAYNQYALDAFRTHAIGYLLKPLDSDELTEQIDLLSRRFTQRPTENPERRLIVNCFGRFSVSASEGNASVIRWKTAKAEELFALLVHYQGRVKSKDSIIDVLWPELEPKKSVNLFRVTCTYLRTALAEMGFSHLLIRELDGYRINTDLISCDLFSFRPVAHSVLPHGIEKLEEASALYSGEYLEGKPYDWASGMRAQLESDYRKIQYCLADAYFCGGFNDMACRALERVLQYDPCEEEAVTRFMRIKFQTGDTTSAIKAYRKYENTLKEELGILPPKELRELFLGKIT